MVRGLSQAMATEMVTGCWTAGRCIKLGVAVRLTNVLPSYPIRNWLETCLGHAWPGGLYVSVMVSLNVECLFACAAKARAYMRAPAVWTCTFTHSVQVTSEPVLLPHLRSSLECHIT